MQGYSKRRQGNLRFPTLNTGCLFLPRVPIDSLSVIFFYVPISCSDNRTLEITTLKELWQSTLSLIIETAPTKKKTNKQAKLNKTYKKQNQSKKQKNEVKLFNQRLTPETQKFYLSF